MKSVIIINKLHEECERIKVLTLGQRRYTLYSGRLVWQVTILHLTPLIYQSSFLCSLILSISYNTIYLIIKTLIYLNIYTVYIYIYKYRFIYTNVNAYYYLFIII